MIKYTTMKRMGLFKTVSLLLGCLTMFSCVDYDDIQPFTGKTLPRKSGYSTGVTNDWIYFNLRTGESFNTYTVNKDIKVDIFLPFDPFVDGFSKESVVFFL